MKPEIINMIRRILPDEMLFQYYADRQSPWLLAQSVAPIARVADLRQSTLAKLLDRPLLRPLVAGCGGVLRQADLLALADAARAPRIGGISRAGLNALAEVYAADWQDYRLSFTGWAVGARYWQYYQISRKGGNLVVQLGFPSEHNALFARYFRKNERKKFEYEGHPVRADKRPTLAWARLDIDLETGVALIEEIQSDWLRNVAEVGQRLAGKESPQSRALKNHQRYQAKLVARYGRDWPRVMMLAVLAMLRDEFACREVWMYQPRAGNVIKNIKGTPPPVSIYSSLPKSFCFEPTREVPAFLARRRRRAVSILEKDPSPLFWRLRFDAV